MNAFVRVVGGIVLLLAIFVWFTHLHPLPVSASGPLSFPLTSLQAGAIAAERTPEPTLSISGVVVIDESAGAPGTPYLAYEDANGHFNTKELIFDTDRGCQVSAGEADCAANLSNSVVAGDVQYPVSSGESISVTGAEVDQTLHVLSFSKVSAAPTNMIIFSVQEGHTAVLSDGTTITPTSYSSDAKCIFGIGCYGNGTIQLSTTITNGKSSKNTILIPGQFAYYGKDSISLISVTGDTNPVSTFLVAVNK